LQKKIEKAVCKKYPRRVSAYSRVTFQIKPYVDALANGDAQEKMNEANNCKFPI